MKFGTWGWLLRTIYLSFDHAISRNHEYLLKILAHNQPVTRSKKSHTRRPSPHRFCAASASGIYLRQLLSIRHLAEWNQTCGAYNGNNVKKRTNLYWCKGFWRAERTILPATHAFAPWRSNYCVAAYDVLSWKIVDQSASNECELRSVGVAHRIR